MRILRTKALIRRVCDFPAIMPAHTQRQFQSTFQVLRQVSHFSLPTSSCSVSVFPLLCARRAGQNFRLRMLSGGGDGDRAKNEGSDKMNAEEPIQKAVNLARTFDPPEHLRILLPTGVLGMLGIHLKANVVLRQRLAFIVQKFLFKHLIDPDFNSDDFVEGAKFAYKVIRHVAANVRTEEELSLIAPMVSPSIMAEILNAAQSSSATQCNTYTLVHDVYAEVLEFQLRMKSEEKVDKVTARISRKEQQRLVGQNIDEGTWLQIKVRFVAMEDEVLGGDGVTVTDRISRATSLGVQARASTWVFEGKVWNLGPKSPDSGSLGSYFSIDEDALASRHGHQNLKQIFNNMMELMEEASKRRQPNPDLSWKFIKVELE